MTAMTYLEAGKAALAEEMRGDARVWALGESPVLAEHAAAAEVLAERPYPRVAAHLLGERRLARFEIGHGGHAGPPCAVAGGVGALTS